ncbi:hypothetical protein CKO28_24125 [Rhodovibrio sodomensis]|uniref:RNA polymerase sigma-70 region 4 domain-containing protein n=1 Tax=Rhodovibrio sodomensis TaxID=1088 RepID=A0ABS1DLI3_9PROT|nr:hypothetical protein [Rhodovibrio sodomensis]MBK1671099.1 hypothetical protein [Rhodovibrio sodomensis]
MAQNVSVETTRKSNRGRPRQVDPDEVLRLHDEERLVDEDIATRIGCSVGTVQKFLCRRRTWRKPHKKKDGVDADLIFRLHSQEGLSDQEIVERVGCSRHQVTQALRKRRVADRRSDNNWLTRKADPKVVRRMWRAGSTVADIAKATGVSRERAAQILDRIGERPRTRRKSAAA